MSPSAYLRALATEGRRPVVVDLGRVDDVLHELKKSGTNLNQIAHHLNRGDRFALAEVSDALESHRRAASAVEALVEEIGGRP